MPKYERKIVRTYEPRARNLILEEYEDWRLVSVEVVPCHEGANHYYLYFEREATEGGPHVG